MVNQTKAVREIDVTMGHKKAMQDLCEYLSRRFGREAVFFIDRNETFEAAIKNFMPGAIIRNIEAIGDLDKQEFSNVILMEVLENLESRLGNEILDKSWKILKKKGNLIVVVPNEDIYQHKNQIRQLNQNELKKILRRFGRPKLMKEQPFKWLAMYVRKNPVKEKNKTVAKRIEVTAELCRGKVIEFGCGRGLLTKKVHDQGLEIIGVDICGKKIIEARSKFPNIEFIQADVLELHLSMDSFDTVLLPEILEHVPEDTGNTMLNMAWDILKPGGRLIVSVPNNQCIPSLNHIRLFTRDSLSTLLENFGKPNIVTEQPYKWLMMYVDKE
jgi:2-polyprenyl-3-methyl-5-hydroxy-6-metoxy-1,4-benzoquinol methylase